MLRAMIWSNPIQWNITFEASEDVWSLTELDEMKEN